MTTVPKPAAVSTWDSNSTNLVAPMAGHKTDGFATNEVPTSAEMNGQLNLFGQWDNFLNALATIGGTAVGNLDIGATALTNYSPLAGYRDSAQNLRSTIDHLGYPGGQIITYVENWKGTITPPSDWTVTATGTASALVGNPSTSTLTAKFLRVLSDGTNGHQALAQAYPPGLLSNTCAIAMEWPMVNETATNTGNLAFGIQIGIPSDTKHVIFTQSGGTLWYWAWKDFGGAGSNAGSTAIAYTGGVPHWFRIEILGSTLTGQSAGTYTLRWFIDSAFIHAETAAFTLPNPALWCPYFQVQTSAASVPDVVDIGPVRINYLL